MKRTKDFLILLIFCTGGILMLQSNNTIISIKNNSFEFSINENLHENEASKYRYEVYANGKLKIKFYYTDTSFVSIVDYDNEGIINNMITYNQNTIDYFLYLVLKIDKYYYLCTDDKPVYFFSSHDKKKKTEIFPIGIYESGDVNIYQFSCKEIDSIIYFSVPYEGERKFEKDVNPIILFNLRTSGALSSIIEKIVLVESIKIRAHSKSNLDEKNEIELVKQEALKKVKELIRSYALQIYKRNM